MKDPLMPLAMMSSGRVVKVVDIRAGRELTKRLTDMGLTTGINIKVVNSQVPGPVVIDLRGSRLVLGHGVAQKILVTEL